MGTTSFKQYSSVKYLYCFSVFCLRLPILRIFNAKKTKLSKS